MFYNSLKKYSKEGITHIKTNDISDFQPVATPEFVLGRAKLY